MNLKKKDHQMKKQTVYRQGDVLLVRVNSAARGEDARENGRIILAHGETTGHCHEVIADKESTVSIQEITDKNDSLFGARLLRVEGRAALKHDEHSTIEIPDGTYRVVRQSEYSPSAVRSVAD